MCMFIQAPNCRIHKCKYVGYMHFCLDRRLYSTLPSCRHRIESGGNVLATAVNEKKRGDREKKRSAAKVAEAHKRKERDRKKVSYP